MSIINDLETLLDDATDTLATLNSLIGQLQVQYPACETITIDLKTQPQGQTSYNTNASKTYTVTLSGSGLVGQDGGGDYTGDAFYYEYAANPGTWLAYGSNGIKINGSIPSPLPSFSNDHTYVLQLNGTGTPFSFNFVDPSYGENNGTLSIEVCLDID
ncbi:MAG: hypothetical protein GC179_08900 [Anaerolineaceae bacterium]|nr:hypothetical protein [Anaerolineaceae bacterium]